MPYRCQRRKGKKCSVKKPVWIKGIGSASTSVNLANRDLFSGLTVGMEAGKEAYKMAGITPKDIDVCRSSRLFYHRRNDGIRKPWFLQSRAAVKNS